MVNFHLLHYVGYMYFFSTISGKLNSQRSFKLQNIYLLQGFSNTFYNTTFSRNPKHIA